MRTITVTTPTGDVLTIPVGMVICDLITLHPDAFPTSGGPAITCTVNNVLTALSERLDVNCTVVPYSAGTPEGAECYRRSLVFLLGKVWAGLCPGQSLQISHSQGHSYYFYPSTVDGNSVDTLRPPVDALKREMLAEVKQNAPILCNVPMNAEDLVEALERVSDHDSVALVRSLSQVRLMTARLGDYVQLYHTPLAPLTGLLRVFDLIEYEDGFVLTFPSKRSPTELVPFKPNQLLHDVYAEYKQWIRVLKVQTIGHLNSLCRRGLVKSFVQICETMQSRKLAELCDVIREGRHYLEAVHEARRQSHYRLLLSGGTGGDNLVRAPSINIADTEIKVVLISGPSSSGKTTLARKLAYNLKVVGREPLVLSMDNYFVDREKTPLREDGSGAYDFEHLDAVDLPLFNAHLEQLIHGEKVLAPVFNFRTGRRETRTVEMIMPFRGIIIVEGIHALNPLVSRSIPVQNKLLVFVAPFTTISMDERTRVSSRDCRLLRRLVRDRNFRGFSAERTLEQLPCLRAGEERWIYPHQHRADYMFNTALDYELCVLSTHAYPLLCELSPDSPGYCEARRLLSLLSKIEAINSEFVPRFSLLREFIGGSGMVEEE